MNLLQAFFQRYDPLYDFYIGTVWKSIPEDLMRRRPYPQVNSIAWNVWHLTRVEDAGLNLFVGDRPQVLDESPDSSGASWMQRLNLPWRHQGSGMTFPEVDELNQRINLQALHEYSDAVQARTREIMAQLNPECLDDILEEKRLRAIIIDEGLAHSDPEGLIRTYAGWPKSKYLLNFGLTHPFVHIGEIDVIASLLGIQF